MKSIKYAFAIALQFVWFSRQPAAEQLLWASFAAKFNEKYSYGKYDAFNLFDDYNVLLFGGMEIKIENNIIVSAEVFITEHGEFEQRSYIYLFLLSANATEQMLLCPPSDKNFS